jgi:hypothetical protein
MLFVLKGGIMKKWDAIIIGAGPSGLCTGALLAKGGKKVLLLEKQNRIGGRRINGMLDGKCIEDGPFGPARAGYLEDIFSRMGKPYPPGRNFEKAEILREGEWKPPLVGIDRGELRSILNEISAYSNEEIQKFDSKTFKDWVSERTQNKELQDFLFMQSTAGLVADRIEQLAASECLVFLKEHLDRWGSLRYIFQLVEGGSHNLIDPLAEFITESGCEIKTDSVVNDIIVKGNNACGVEVEVGKRLISGQIRDVESIEAPVVICTVPVWDLFKVVSEDRFPPWYIDWVKRLSSKVCHLTAITFGLKKAIWKPEVMRWNISPAPRTKVAMGAYFETETILQVYCQLQWYEYPFLLDRNKAINRRKTRAFFKDFEEDAYELFPDLKENMKWKIHNTSGPFEISNSPGLVGVCRINSGQTPINNFYLVGNNLSHRGLGWQALAHSATCCADEILGKIC